MDVDEGCLVGVGYDGCWDVCFGKMDDGCIAVEGSCLGGDGWWNVCIGQLANRYMDIEEGYLGGDGYEGWFS